MNDLLLRPEQDVEVLIAANDPKLQRVEVRRVDKADAGRVIPSMFDEQARRVAERACAAQSQLLEQLTRAYNQSIAAPWGGPGSYYSSPLAAMLGGIRC